MYGGRYGIWGVDPYSPDVMDRALRTSEGLGLMRGQALQRQQLGLANEMARANFDYLPHQRQMAQDEFQLKEKIGNAQIQHLMAQAQQAQREKDPAYQFKEVMRMYQGAKDDTPEKLYYGSLLNNMMGAGVGAGMKVPGVGGASGSSVGGGQLGAPSSGPNGAVINPGTISDRSKRGMQYAVQNPDGTFTTYASPTMANETTQENRLAAEPEAKIWYEEAQKGAKPYKGFGSTGRMLGDLLLYHLGGKKGDNARERLEGLGLTNRVSPAVTATIAKMDTGQNPGVEQQRMYEEHLFPGMPLWAQSLLPNSIQNAVDDKFFALQKKGIEATVAAGRNNYPMTMESAPSYAQGSSQPVFRFSGNNARDMESMRLAHSPQAQSTSPKKESKSGWGENGYAHSDGRIYTRAELEKIARSGK